MAAPAIVRVASLMPVRVMPPDADLVLLDDQLDMLVTEGSWPNYPLNYEYIWKANGEIIYPFHQGGNVDVTKEMIGKEVTVLISARNRP